MPNKTVHKDTGQHFEVVSSWRFKPINFMWTLEHSITSVDDIQLQIAFIGFVAVFYAS